MNNEVTNDLAFPFGGKLASVMNRHFEQDASSATLSRKFRLYYHLRPLIPIKVRQMLQRGRNQNLDVPADWYLPNEFAKEFRNALTEELEGPGDRLVIHPWPQPFQMCASLTHDVETRDGVLLVDKLAKLEESLGFRSCWNFVPYKYQIEPELIEDLIQRGHEVGVHGYNHDGRLFFSQRTFNRRLGPIKDAMNRFQSEGFRAPMVHRNLNWISKLEAKYDSSCFDVDPFQAMPGGVGSVWPFLKGNMVELPYTLPQDHTLMIALNQSDISIWRNKFDWLRRWRGMAMLITHPDYLNTAARLELYRQYLDFLTDQSDCWTALPRDIANWWKERSESRIEHDNLIAGPASDRATATSLSNLFRSLCNGRHPELVHGGSHSLS